MAFDRDSDVYRAVVKYLAAVLDTYESTSYAVLDPLKAEDFLREVEHRMVEGISETVWKAFQQNPATAELFLYAWTDANTLRQTPKPEQDTEPPSDS